MSSTSALVLAGLRVDRVDLVEAELQPVGLLRQFACPLGTVGEVAAGVDCHVSRTVAVPLQLRADVGEAVQRGALLVAAHQPQLIVLPVQGQQFGGEACSATSPARCGHRGRPATGRRG